MATIILEFFKKEVTGFKIHYTPNYLRFDANFAVTCAVSKKNGCVVI